jgi:hypothetical protein
MPDHKIARLTLHSSWPERVPMGDLVSATGSTLTSEFAAGLLQMQQSEIFDTLF